VVALINLALPHGPCGAPMEAASVLCVDRTTCRAAAIWGAIPDRLPGFQHFENDELRGKFEKVWGAKVRQRKAGHISHMLGRHGARRADRTLLLGETRADSEADRHRALKLLGGLDSW